MQIALFEMSTRHLSGGKDDKLREELKKLDLETMTPLEALQKLAEMKKSIQNSTPS